MGRTEVAKGVEKIMRRRIGLSSSLARRARLPKVSVEEIAPGIARQILSQLEGPRDEVSTWVKAAEALGAVVYGFYGQPGDGPGFYDGRRGIICYNLCASKEKRIRYLLHEIAHHALATWPGSRFPRIALERYDDDRQSVQHRVARRVEEILLGEE